MISDIILLEQHSDDVLFSFTHWFSFSSSHKKSASCVISILPQLTDFLQTFFQRVEKQRHCCRCFPPFYLAACIGSLLSVALFGCKYSIDFILGVIRIYTVVFSEPK